MLKTLKHLSLCLLAALALLAPMSAQAQTYSVGHTTDFTTAPNTNPVGAGQVLYDNLTDVSGNQYKIVGGVLATNGGVQGSLLMRPSAENFLNGGAELDITSATNNYANVVLRQTANGEYQFGYGGGTFSLYYTTNTGGISTLSTHSQSLTAGEVYRVRTTVQGTSPSTFTETLTDEGTPAAMTAGTNTPTVVNTWTDTDSTASGQAAGSVGIPFFANSGSSGIRRFSTVTVAASAATSYTASLSATSGQTGSPVTLTYAANGTGTQTITPSVSGVSGTFSPTSVSLSGTSPVSVTFTPSSAGTATISSANSGSLTNPAALTYTVNTLPAGSTITIPVSSPAFRFSPLWVGDTGRSGSVYRQSAYPGQYFRVRWTTTSTSPTATLNIDNSVEGSSGHSASITYRLDGVLTENAAASGSITLSPVGSGQHDLVVYIAYTPLDDRWGSAGVSPTSELRVTGLTVDGGSTAGTADVYSQWIEIVGDSITDGYQAGVSTGNDATLDYSYLMGQGFLAAGYEYGMDAFCGSGWLATGNGNAPALYFISGSTSGSGGTYTDSVSRWNKLDARTSLLDANNHLSSYGSTGQEPAAIFWNLFTNECLQTKNISDAQAAVTQGLAAYRAAAPNAWLFPAVPFNLRSTAIYGSNGPAYVAAFVAGVNAYKAAHPSDAKIFLIDLGANAANTLASSFFGGAIHPNYYGHAWLAPQVQAQILGKLTGTVKIVTPHPVTRGH